MSEKRVSGAVARERFSAAFADRPRRSLAAEVRAQLPEIEKRLADGYGYDAVVAAFAEIESRRMWRRFTPTSIARDAVARLAPPPSLPPTL